LPRDVHPFLVATQAHPEFRSRPTRAHPLFTGLIAAGLNRRRERAAMATRQDTASSEPSELAVTR
jgi:CTP synthase